MEMSIWLWLFGCVGITLIITAGKIFEGLRDYLTGFRYWYNPLRQIGVLMKCSMCTGFWVGFLWNIIIIGETVLGSVLWGGVVSIVAYAIDMVLLGFSKLFGERHEEHG